MIFYCLMILCIASMVNCADTDKIKSPKTNRMKEAASPARKFQDKEEKRRRQNKKKAQNTDLKRSLRSLTGSSEDIEDALDRLMT